MVHPIRAVRIRTCKDEVTYWESRRRREEDSSHVLEGPRLVSSTTLPLPVHPAPPLPSTQFTPHHRDACRVRLRITTSTACPDYAIRVSSSRRRSVTRPWQRTPSTTSAATPTSVVPLPLAPSRPPRDPLPWPPLHSTAIHSPSSPALLPPPPPGHRYPERQYSNSSSGHLPRHRPQLRPRGMAPVLQCMRALDPL